MWRWHKSWHSTQGISRKWFHSALLHTRFRYERVVRHHVTAIMIYCRRFTREMLLILIAICFINLGSFAAAKGCKQTSLKVLRLMIAKKKKKASVESFRLSSLSMMFSERHEGVLREFIIANQGSAVASTFKLETSLISTSPVDLHAWSLTKLRKIDDASGGN